ncbi:MAG: tail fiber domain-containing protein [Desulfobacteraceae bacterium]|nr:tail fiber domain-containing protein [Desulfobacteraceae bacterium]
MRKARLFSRFGSRLGKILPVMIICFIMTGTALGEDKLIVKDGSGTTTFKVEDDGAVSASGKLLVQRPDHGHVATFFRQTDGDAEIQIGQSTAVNKAAVIGFNQAGAYYYMSVYGLGLNRMVFNSSGYLGVGTTSPSYPLEMSSGAHVTTGGAWTNASSREYKKDIKELTGDEAMDALKQLSPVKFSYKANSEERHVGFIAEDAPDLVVTKDRKGMSSMDVVAVLTKVVQEQQKTIAELSKKMSELERELKLKNDVAMVATDLSLPVVK